MKTLNLISSLVLLIAIGCEGDSHSPDILLEVTPNLTLDGNGYYHLNINTGSWQTLHRLSGTVYKDSEPLDVLKVYWEASHYWYMGDTLGFSYTKGLTHDLNYVTLDTTYITGFNGLEVPVVNSTCYSNSDGEVNTMFAPVRSMVGDTVVVWIYYWNYDDELMEYNIFIILD
jgi:hypothetical protein